MRFGMGNGGGMMRGKSDPGATHMPDERDNSGILQRKLATILSADVASFSRLMGEDEEGTLKTFRGHKKVFESLVTMHRGRIFNTAGDAILAEFGSAVEAVRCATDIQAALRTRNDQLAASRQVRFRIGINLGDVMLQGEDLMGDGVNVAARLQTAAEPGGICISGSVHDQIRNKLSLTFHSLGEQNFKNIQEPVRTFSIVEAGGNVVLPTAKHGGAGSSATKWIAAGVLLVLVAGGAYWAYTVTERSKAETARANAAATPPVLPAPEAAKPSVEKPATEQPVQPANAARPTSEPGAGAAEAPRKTTPHGPTRSAGAAAATSAVAAGPYDGVYSGQICYGKTLDLPARCFRAEGTIRGHKISGQWAGADPGSTMFLRGDVATSGDVKIEMHSEKPDGTIPIVIDLTGTLHDGLIKASGTFRRGRTATLNWQKNSRAAH
jgi:class 3 adenylate cyclase